MPLDYKGYVIESRTATGGGVWQGWYFVASPEKATARTKFLRADTLEQIKRLIDAKQKGKISRLGEVY